METYVGVIILILFIVCIALGIPIAFSLLGVSMIGLISLIGVHATFSTVSSSFFNYIANYSLSVIPLFVLMGMTAANTGVLDDVFTVSRKWFGNLKASEGLATVAANTVFAAASGSSIAACIVIGRSALPAMRKAGYPDHVSTGLISASGTIASLIPPSILICIYGIVVNESIGKLLIAGVIPGFIQALLYVGIVLWLVRNVTPRNAPGSSLWKKIVSTGGLWPVIFIVISVMGTIYAGICTPTEAAAIGSLATFFLAFVRKKLNFQFVKKITVDTVATTGMILIILSAAVIFSKFLLSSGITESLINTVKDLQLHPFMIFVLVIMIYLLLGCFITPAPMMIITLPVFYPIMMALGFNSLWFGIMVVSMSEIAMITPPIGLNAYVTRSLDPNLPLSTVFHGSAYFLIADLIRMFVYLLFPIIVTYLPMKMG